MNISKLHLFLFVVCVGSSYVLGAEDCKIVSQVIEYRKQHAKEPIRLNITIEKNNEHEGITEILKHIRKEWSKDNLKFKRFTNGYTNIILGCWDDTKVDRDHMVMFRIYGDGTSSFIDRKNEIRNIENLNKEGYSPLLYAIFTNGLAYEYAIGNTLTVDEEQTDSIFPLVAEMTALVHKANFSTNGIQPKPFIWNAMYTFISLVPDKYEDQKKQYVYENELPNKTAINLEVQFLKRKLSALKAPIVFCHNDLWPGNMIYNKGNSTQAPYLSFIDYEYSNYNYEPYDIANHFLEYAGLPNPDYSLYPKKSYQRKWLRKYFETLHGTQNGEYSCKKGYVSTAEIDEKIEIVKKFTLASHLFWGIWGLVQGNVSSLNIDYMRYAVVRFNEYYKRRDEYLGS